MRYTAWDAERRNNVTNSVPVNLHIQDKPSPTPTNKVQWSLTIAVPDDGFITSPKIHWITRQNLPKPLVFGNVENIALLISIRARIV